MSVVLDFSRLFAGRTDAWGSVEGACVREAVGIGRYGQHLETPGRSLGIYPLIQDATLAELWAGRLGGPVGDNFVHWGCTDIDNKADPESCWPLAVNMHGALGALGISSWIERTKGKGYHVWVFADEWVPAIVMRRALLVGHHVAGVAASEVNPKQVDVGARVTFGNYVNLPYAHDWRGEDKRVVVQHDDASQTVPLDLFVELALGRRASFETLLAAAKFYKEPPKRSVDRSTPPSGDAQELSGRLPGLAYTIWKDGPLEARDGKGGRDRSNTLQRLAHLCVEAGLNAADTLVLVSDADRRWGKFHDRADGAQHLEAMVLRAAG